MISRVWDCKVVPDTLDGLLEWIDRNSWPKVRVVPGFEGGELYTPLGARDRIVTVSHWSGTDAIASYVGQDWQERPIVYEEERPYLVGEPTLTHYELMQRITPASDAST
jgi:heme-degrading monooxygenase HmoA